MLVSLGVWLCLIVSRNLHRLKAVYGDDAVDRSSVNRWVIKFRGWEPGKAIIVKYPLIELMLVII